MKLETMKQREEFAGNIINFFMMVLLVIGVVALFFLTWEENPLIVLITIFIAVCFIATMVWILKGK